MGRPLFSFSSDHLPNGKYGSDVASSPAHQLTSTVPSSHGPCSPLLAVGCIGWPLRVTRGTRQALAPNARNTPPNPSPVRDLAEIILRYPQLRISHAVSSSDRSEDGGKAELGFRVLPSTAATGRATSPTQSAQAPLTSSRFQRIDITKPGTKPVPLNDTHFKRVATPRVLLHQPSPPPS